MNSRKTKRVKSNGERERYNQLNTEFQRIARRDKKAFFKEKCLIIQENNKRESLEISSGKLETSREYLTQRWAQ